MTTLVIIIGLIDLGLLCYMFFSLGKFLEFQDNDKRMIQPAMKGWGKALDMIKIKDQIIEAMEELVIEKDKKIKSLENKLHLCRQSKSRNK